MLRRKVRAAFTLIELMVVILIIAVLVSLISSAAMLALGKIPQVQTSAELGQLNLAMQSFMSDYQLNDPPPSSFVLIEDRNAYYNSYGNPASGLAPAAVPTMLIMQRIFGKNWMHPPINVRTASVAPPLGLDDWNGNGVNDGAYLMQGQQCLVFYAGGVPTPLGNNTFAMTGFLAGSYDPSAPASYIPAGATTAPQRRGPYFNFLSQRVAMDQRNVNSPFPVYQDPYQNKSSAQCYAFFSTGRPRSGKDWHHYYPTDCSNIGAFLYYQPPTTPMNMNRFQIICAGKDATFGYDTSPPYPNVVAWSPVSGFLGTPPVAPGSDAKGTTAGNDDQANFGTGLLGAGQ